MQSPVVVEQPVPNAEADMASATLWAAGATAVEWREDGTTTTLVASFPTPEGARIVAGEIGGAVTEITDMSWEDAWRAYATPVEVTARLVISPGWKAVPVGGGRLIVDIDPGACFGSGSHPSTRLALKLLADGSLLGKRVLDVGTGSGVLAVAAARLGALAVTAIDTDPDAVAVTVANATSNAVRSLIDVSTDPVASLTTTFDVAVVNVTAAAHASLARDVVRRVRPGGVLVLAGLLPGQWRHVAAAYDGCTLVDCPVLDGWSGVRLRRDQPMSPSGGPARTPGRSSARR